MCQGENEDEAFSTFLVYGFIRAVLIRMQNKGYRLVKAQEGVRTRR